MIILDIDGVVADYFSELVHILNISGMDADHWTSWNDYHWHDIFPNIDRDVIDLLLENPMIAKNCKPFEDAWYWTNYYSSTYDIMYVTARNPELSQHTWNWFYNWDMPADFVVFEQNKPEFLANLQVDVYVDDYPDMVEKSREYGVNAYLLNRPYNVNSGIPDEFRINSLWELDFL